jgi:hypothetical protein
MEAAMPDDIWVFVAIGFLAQLVDGALGMAFGVLCTSSLLAFGVAPAVASAMTHAAEVFTTAASGASHAWHRNVDWRLVARLAPAGMIGGAIGAYALSSIDADFIRPIISIYLIAMGCFIIFKVFGPLWPRQVRDWLVPFIGAGGGVPGHSRDLPHVRAQHRMVRAACGLWLDHRRSPGGADRRLCGQSSPHATDHACCRTDHHRIDGAKALVRKAVCGWAPFSLLAKKRKGRRSAP